MEAPVAKFAAAVPQALSQTAAVAVSNPPGSFLGKMFHAIAHAFLYVRDVVDVVRQVVSSLFYKGPSHKPWEVTELPPQTGPKGFAIPIDRQAFANAVPGDNVSSIAQELIEKNAPVVRQMANDSYPLSGEDLLQHAHIKSDGSYELDNSFADDPAASRRYQPAIHGTATKVDDHTIALEYTRIYPNSYISQGALQTLPRETWHEGDQEGNIFYYDLNKGEITGASVYKHGFNGPAGQKVVYSQDQIEFKDGHPVVTVAYGSHATGITGGMEEADTNLAHQVKRFFGRPILDHYPTRDEVWQGRAVDLTFAPEHVIVPGVETVGGVRFTETDRWLGGFRGDERMGSSNFPAPII